MTNLSLYQQYLVASQIEQRLASVGLVAQHVMSHREYDNRGSSGLQVSASIDYDGADGNWMFPAEREAKLNEFLTLYPDVTVARESVYGAPDMKARWVSAHGIAVEVNFHEGTCEKKQVGTKKVTTYDPEALAALPRVEIEEPIFEYMCPDPILAGAR